MNISKKIKTIGNRLEQNKPQYNLERQTTFLSGNVSEYKFLTGKGVLPKKDLLQKAATMKRFEYSQLGKELKLQNSVAEKQYQAFDKVFNHNEKEEPVKIKKEAPLIAILFYNKKYSFTEFRNVGKCKDDFLVSRYNNYLAPFKQQLEEIKKFTIGKAKTKEKKKIAYNNDKKLYSILLNIYCNDYNDMTDEEKEKMDEKYNPNDLFIKGQNLLIQI